MVTLVPPCVWPEPFPFPLPSHSAWRCPPMRAPKVCKPEYVPVSSSTTIPTEPLGTASTIASNNDLDSDALHRAIATTRSFAPASSVNRHRLAPPPRRLRLFAVHSWITPARRGVPATTAQAGALARSRAGRVTGPIPWKYKEPVLTPSGSNSNVNRRRKPRTPSLSGGGQSIKT